MPHRDRFSAILERLFDHRSLSEAEQEGFLNPDYGLLHDPMLLPGMGKVCERVMRAIKDDEQIVVYSDYDADGIPGAVVLSDFFRRIGYGNVSFYIPHRHDEGFGLNMEAVEEIAKRMKPRRKVGAPTKASGLMITVDCGTADFKEVERANSLGMDVIITDHHEPPQDLPPAYAIVNPRLKGSDYPFKELCGAAVAYKLVQAVLASGGFDVKEGMEKWSLDMVGIATLSDMVPLVGENRILASFGLDVLRKSPRPGLRALFDKLRMNQRYLSEDDIAFMITPRINAASRMGVPMDAFLLLSADDEAEAARLAAHLEEVNNSRKTLVATVVKEAKSHLAKRQDMPQVIVVGNPEWRPSLAGLVANSLVEEYERPAFVWGRDGDGKLKGSCRSYNGCNLYELMSSTPESFTEYGGHAGAGGFSATLEQIAVLEERLTTAFGEVESSESILGGPTAKPEEVIEIEVGDIREDLWSVVSKFAPFGTGNPKPVFEISCEVAEVKKFGRGKEHLELTLRDKGSSMKAISFFSSLETYKLTNFPTSVIVRANLEKSYFRHIPELRLRIVDIM